MAGHSEMACSRKEMQQIIEDRKYNVSWTIYCSVLSVWPCKTLKVCHTHFLLWHLKPFIQSAHCDGSCIDFKCFYFSLKGGDIDFLGINICWSSWKRKADALYMPGTCSHTTIKLVYLRGRLQVDILTFKMPQVRWPPNPPLVMCDISLFSILMVSSASDSECRTGYVLN